MIQAFDHDAFQSIVIQVSSKMKKSHFNHVARIF